MQVERIELFSRWVGFADPPSRATKLEIRRRGAGFECLSSTGAAEELPPQRIAELGAALAEPPVPELDLSRFTEPPDVVSGHYNSIWTDDYPQFRVKVWLTDGQVLTATSDAQHAYMLPWKIRTAEGDSLTTYNPRISRAVAALLPEGFLNKDRLAGAGLAPFASGEEPPVAPEERAPGVPDREAEPERTADRRLLETCSIPMTALFRGLLGGGGEPASLDRAPLAEIQELIAGGADLNSADDAGQTALMHAAYPPFDGERFRLLAAAGADVNARRRDGATGLHLAASGGEEAAAAAWMEVGADVNAVTPEGETPLMLAVAWPGIVRRLLAAGADVHAADAAGATALIHAVHGPAWSDAELKMEVMRLLLDAGADVNARDREGRTALTHALAVAEAQRTEAEVERELAGGPFPGEDSPSGGERLCAFLRQLGGVR